MTIIEKARLMRSKLDMACTFLTDVQAEEVTVLFPEWEVGVQYRKEDKEKGIPADRRQYKGLLYKCIQSHISQSDWTPDIAVSLWVRTSTEEWPEWKQPQGAHDAYNKGDKCSYKGKHYICTADGNIYPPDVFGWEEVV